MEESQSDTRPELSTATRSQDTGRVGPPCPLGRKRPAAEARRGERRFSGVQLGLHNLEGDAGAGAVHHAEAAVGATSLVLPRPEVAGVSPGELWT